MTTAPEPDLLRVELVDPRTLTPHPRNPRQGDVGAIVEMIRATGWHTILTRQASTGFLVAGNHRALAACAVLDAIERDENGWREWADAHPKDPLSHGVVPVEWKDLDDEEALEKLVADNRANDLATYDEGALAELLEELAANDHLAGAGWDGEQLDMLLNDLRGPVAPDDFPDPEVHLGGDYRCPRCSYEWSGRAKPETGAGGE